MSEEAVTLKPRSHILRAALVLLPLCASTGASQSAPVGRDAAAVPSRRGPRIVASTILEDLQRRKKERPDTSPRELAAYANALLREKGFNYSFDACDILKANGKSVEGDAQPTGALETFRYMLAGVDGRRVAFRIVTRDDEGGGMCGECFFYIPALRVTRDEMVVLSEGRRYRLRRPKAFALDEAALVDRTLRRVVRTWQLPFETIPDGVSPDGTKLYTSFYEDYNLGELLLELSEGGTLRFVARTGARARGGEWVEDFPKDPHNAYLSYMRFRAGGKSYIVKFNGPCT